MDTWTEEDLQLDLDLYSDIIKTELSDASPIDEFPAETSPLNWDKEEYSWKAFGTNLFENVNVLPVTVENSDDQDALSDIPSPGDILSEAASLVLPNRHPELMARYELTDEELGDMTLKQLKRRCSGDEDYAVLKSYRRTCLNRGYARSSRSKQQNKSLSLSAKLEAAENKICRMEKELDEKNMRIQYLELENRLLMDFNRSDN